MKSLRNPLLSAAFAGLASLATTHATAAPYASFSEMEADWQGLSSPGTAWHSAQNNLSRTSADPIERAMTRSDKTARFQAEETAWQRESRADNPADQPPAQVEARGTSANALRAERVRNFADTERADQQLSTP